MVAIGWPAGEAANMLIGHGIGLLMSDSHEFNNGAFYYYSKGQTPFTIGGAIIGDKEELGRYNIINGQRNPRHTVEQHERAHFPQQTALSVGYIPAHLLSQGISVILSGFTSIHRYNLLERWWIDVPSY